MRKLRIIAFIMLMAAACALCGCGRRSARIEAGATPTPETVQYLGKVLPLAVFGMLVVYCLKNVSFLAGSRGIPELAANKWRCDCGCGYVLRVDARMWMTDRKIEVFSTFPYEREDEE